MGPPREPRQSRGTLWRYYLLLFSLLMAAVNTGNNLLYLVFSIMIAVGAVSFVAAGRALRRLETVLRLPDEAVAGRPFLLGVEAAAGPGTAPAPWAEATLRGLPVELPALLIPALPPGGRTVICVQARAGRRGVHRSFGLGLRSRYPFGLFQRTKITPSDAAMIVTPRRFPIQSIEIAPPTNQGQLRALRVGEGAELFNIRDYTTQDDARRIDWKASARLHRPMLKEFEKETERALDLVLDERAADGAAAHDFERLVETAASILDHCAEKGIFARLIVPGEAGGCGALSGREAISYLAEASARPGAASPGDLSSGDVSAPRIVLSLHAGAATPLLVHWAGEGDHP